jgi:alpha-glucosidase (family GH31 glycosyl hydrolase)
MWSDIDYMSDYKLFTLSDAYSRFPEIIKKIKAAGGRYVPIIDPGVAKRPGQNYQAYEQGLAQNAFIKTAAGTPFTGNVWPGLVHYTDFTTDTGVNYWNQ